MDTTATPTFDIGDGVRSTVAFLDINQNPADPTLIVFKLKDPSGTVTTPQVFRNDTGKYFADFIVPANPGTWTFRWEGTGNVTAADENRFKVRQSLFY